MGRGHEIRCGTTVKFRHSADATDATDATKTAKTPPPTQKHVRGLESPLAPPLLIRVAHQRQACVYKAPNVHLKSLAASVTML